jgi:allantoinase
MTNCPIASTNGLINLPLNHELSDRQIITVQQQSADSYAEQMRDAFDAGSPVRPRVHGGRLLPLNITPYIMGLPYRIDAFERLLAWLAARDGVGFVTTAEAASAVA